MRTQFENLIERNGTAIDSLNKQVIDKAEIISSFT
jgi:hypothetical protein